MARQPRRGFIPFEPHNEPPEGSDVDWDRYAGGAKSRAADPEAYKRTPSGDPLKWGGETKSHLLHVKGNPKATVTAQQVVRADTMDLYARNWQLIGAITAPVFLWEANPLEILWTVFIDVVMGGGQVTLTHRFKGRELTDLALDSGVYAKIKAPLGAGVLAPETRAFVITGGLVGKSINARVETTLVSIGAGPVQVEADFATSLILAPIMAGMGI